MPIFEPCLVSRFYLDKDRCLVAFEILTPVFLPDENRLVQVGQKAPPESRCHHLRTRAEVFIGVRELPRLKTLFRFGVDIGAYRIDRFDDLNIEITRIA